MFTEKALQLGEFELLGIHSIPVESRSRIGLVFLNGGLVHRVGPFNLNRALARNFAGQGIHCVRIDQSGKGDSPRTGLNRLAALQRDIDEVSTYLRKVGCQQLVLVGLCSGADDALEIAEYRDNLKGIVLLDGYSPKDFGYYVARYGPKLFSLKTWKARITSSDLRARVEEKATAESLSEEANLRNWGSSSTMRARFAEVGRRGVKCLAVFTSDADDYYAYEGQLTKNLSKHLRRDFVSEIFFREAKHVYPLALHRDKLFKMIHKWVLSELAD